MLWWLGLLANRYGLLVGFLLVIAVVLASPVRAHANLLRAIPSPGTTVEVSPKVVYAEFSESIDSSFSSVDVVRVDGQSVATGPARPDPTSDSAMLVPVALLEHGTYVVVWRTLSNVDGHIIRGSYAFAVGQPVSADVEIFTARVDSSPVAGISRGLLFAGVIVFIGAPLHMVVQRRGLVFAQQKVFESRVSLLLLIGGLLAFTGQVGVLGAQVVALGMDSFTAGFGEVFASGSWGVFWIARTVALVIGLVLIDRVSEDDDNTPARAAGFLAISAIGVGMAASISLSSHAAAISEFTPALLADVLHLTAVGVWAGGLPVLLLTIGLLRRNLAGVKAGSFVTEGLSRFSAIATVSVGVIVVTGLYGTWLEVLEISRLWTTEYGVVLLIKLALVGPLFGLGAINKFWVLPRLRRLRGVPAPRWRLLRSFVIVEVVLACAVLLVVGFLTEREPARQVVIVGKSFVEAAGSSADIGLNVRATPGRPGSNVLEFDVRAKHGSLTPQTTIAVEFKYLEADVGTVVGRPTRADGSTFSLDTDALNLAGEWQALVTIRSPGEFDVRVPIRFQIGGPDSSGVPKLDMGVAARFWALAVFGMGLVLTLSTLSRHGWTPWARRVGTITGFGVIVIGGAMLLAGPDELAGEALINPVVPDEISVGAGQGIYEDLCSSCHGPEGRGDGPRALALDPPPLDLAVHVPLHPDGQLFAFIRDGIEGTAMAGFGEQLGATEIWDVINFLQTLPAKANG